MPHDEAHLFVPELIVAKRDGHHLTATQIEKIVEGFMDGSVADYQMAALCMAVFFEGMSFDETVALTLAMRDSGKVLDFSDIAAPKIGKHSTGGVGDKVSICLAPIMAACGLTVPKLSGHGLGHTGGTLDKLEAIPGFRVDLSVREFRAQLRKIGVALISQTAELAPADKRMYALRDVTGTVESVPLITASILSKKLAEGLDGLVLDVKTGRGAFMKTRSEAEGLAKSLVRVGRLAGSRVSAVLTEMDAPIGYAVGNALETAEAIELLHGSGPEDLEEITLALGAEMLRLGGMVRSKAEAMSKQKRAIADGSGLNKLRALVDAQGGDRRVVDEPDRLRPARVRQTVKAVSAGYVGRIDALSIGQAAMNLGAGRTKTGASIDSGAGLLLHVKRGDRVRGGDPLATLHTSKKALLRSAVERVEAAFSIRRSRPPHRSRVLDIVRR